MDIKTPLPQLVGTDPLDVFRNHLNPDLRQELTPTQAIRMAEYRFVLATITAGSTLQKAVKILQSEYKLTQGTAYRRVQETFHIFGDFLKSEKSAKKVVYVEWLENVMTECIESARFAESADEKMKYLDMADRYMGKLIKIQELDKNSPISKTGKDQEKPIAIIFTTGPIPEQNEVQDADFEIADSHERA